MSPSEEAALADLLAKKKAEEERGGQVFRLFPGGRQDDTPLVQKLRNLLGQAERGEF